jgi:membrane protein implicated in regulation of membrane protease activity
MGGTLRPIGLLVGLVGAGLTFYALFSLFGTLRCIASLDGSLCTEPLVPPTMLLPLGIVLCVAGMLMGGGMLVFSALFEAIGLAALVAGALGFMPMMSSFPWIFGTMFCLGGLVPLLVGRAMGRAAASKQAMAMELMRSGTRGIGTIVEVSDTGVSINNNPSVRIRMRIEPLDGSAAVERSKTALVSRVAIPRAGERYPAFFDPADPDKWMYATDMDDSAPAEVKALFARARAGAGGAPPAATESDDNAVIELTRLSELWKSGALSDAEFADAKARLLPQIGS